ncbi:hypothetical protein ACFSO7_23385 [Bacillus sp. CGMCC 1.16607]|uniref:hypothetical protein n=1 Tax=Bacillus sp. CGMCC 1.16607 TaxID=3351842 RepID=UPI00363C0CA9
MFTCWKWRNICEASSLLAGNGEILAEVSSLLAGNGGILAEVSSLLAANGGILAEVSSLLAANGGILAEVSSLLVANGEIPALGGIYLRIAPTAKLYINPPCLLIGKILQYNYIYYSAFFNSI